MPIQRIDHDGCRSHGWQVRAPIEGKRYLSRFFADQAHGGKRRAYQRALLEQPLLERQARRLRRGARR